MALCPAGRRGYARRPRGDRPELAAAYLRVAQGKRRYTRLFAEKGFAPEPSPAGNRVYGYNASVSHRRADWLVTVAGHSRYLWSAEIYQGSQPLRSLPDARQHAAACRRRSRERLRQRVPAGGAGTGGTFPRTTALEIPMERMKADIRNVDTASGYEEMLLDEAFAGGVSHRGRDGVFAMELHEARQIQRFAAGAPSRGFFFDNRIVCMGSDIENKAEGGVHTTLFQNFLADAADPLVVNGEAVTQFPYRPNLRAAPSARQPAQRLLRAER